MTEKIGVGILGGTGYGAGELLRLLVQHPEVKLASITSTSSAGAEISSVHTNLEGFFDCSFEEALDIKKLSQFSRAVVFCSLPHGASARAITELSGSVSAGTKIIDLSGDFRLKNESSHKEFYPDSTAPKDLRDKFQYGLTELYREQIADSQFIANPGCYSTACILSVAPLVTSEFSSTVFFDAKSGTSGAGKSPSAVTHHPVQHANFLAYKVLEHRHEPEIREGLGDIEGGRIETTFVPHLLPVSRGILVTAQLVLDKETGTEELQELYREFYAKSPFVRVRKKSPEFRDILCSNFCDVSVIVRGRQVVAMAAIDNLVKGMVGQAVQNMNIMFGLEETTGLWQPSFGPI